MKKELTILIAWHDEQDKEKQVCFEENKKTFSQFNPDVDIFEAKNPYSDSKEAWLSSDLSIFTWFNTHSGELNSERFLLIEWDCWCDIDLKEYFHKVWDADVAAPSVKYPERDTWYWFDKIHELPSNTQIYATGVVPFCGILVSEKAMQAICVEILKPEYRGINSELRFATIATMLGYDPVPTPVCSRPITWKAIIPFDHKYKGLHHPRKTLSLHKLPDNITTLLQADKNKIPKILHQTWKNDSPPEHLLLLAETWKTKHPDWLYLLWTDDMNYHFINTFFPDFLTQYNSYDTNIQRVDAVRYFILYKLGGLFIDLDFECIENIEPLLENADCIFGLEPDEHCTQFEKEKIICNAFMACKPDNDFFSRICSSLTLLPKSQQGFLEKILSTTGPFALTEIYDNYERKNEIILLPSSAIYPLTVSETNRVIDDDIDDEIQHKIENAYAVHYFLGSWY